MIKRPKSGARAARACGVLMVNILNKPILNTLVHNLFLDRHWQYYIYIGTFYIHQGISIHRCISCLHEIEVK